MISVGISFAGGIVSANSGLFSKTPEISDLEIQNEKRESGYSFINPLLECEYGNNQGNTKLAELKKSVEAEVARHPDIEISLYYRDLLNGPWYGHNEQTTFAPQSLLKMPILFAYLKIADENPSILDEKIIYEQEIDSNLPDGENLSLGESYTVLSLIERTVVISDNVAFTLLVDNLPLKFVQKVHEDLNIPYPSEETPSDFVSVRSYSSVFRVLYNSSYLTRKNSEFLLELLAESTYKEGLVAGVPESTIVAHKFGIKNPTDDDASTQLHDCGVIYEKNRPYVLCVMTKGTDQKAQATAIQKMSEVVHKVVSE
ncbi:MAG: serine hydrolase [Microgenomates group bacterium]